MFMAEALFATLTNTNFDDARLQSLITQAIAIRDALPKSSAAEPDACTWTPKNDADIAAKAAQIAEAANKNDDVSSLRALLLFGLKGVAAYYHHAAVLGYTDTKVTDFMQKGLASTLHDLPADQMTALVLECGGIGVTTLALLDTANTKSYGNPEITSVKTTTGDPPRHPDHRSRPQRSPAAARTVEGQRGRHLHPRRDAARECLPGVQEVQQPCRQLWLIVVPPEGRVREVQRADPRHHELYRSAKGQLQGPDLHHRPGRIPRREAHHCRKGREERLLGRHRPCERPASLPQDLHAPGRDLITGCAHGAVLAIAGTVIDAVKKGDIKRFVVMAGCDGRQAERSYYTEFAQALPKDTVILTAGCAKYRYNGLDLGTIGGIPRVIDAGQCNDCYSLVVIAQALAGAFGVGINELPISYNIAWYEQKAALVLLALLNLGVKDITLGPKLPAFVSPGVLNVLVDNFGIKKNSTVEADLARMVP